MSIKKTYQSAKGVPVKVWTEDLDKKAEEQLRNISSLSIIHHHVAVMPDAHLGIGCTIGSVIPTLAAIIPAAVGVDIGCGMMAAKTNLHAKDLPDNLSQIRHSIERTIPLGPGARHQKDMELGGIQIRLYQELKSMRSSKTMPKNGSRSK